jgi:ribose 5-phosphate isomerase A
LTSPGTPEGGLQLAAKAIVDGHLKSGMVLGLGSGSAVAKFAKKLGESISMGDLKDVSIVPSSMQSWLLAKENSIPIIQDSAHCPAALDAAVDGADQISLKTRSMIKGGGGALLREKVILSSAKQSYILVDETKISEKLNRFVPVEVVQFAVESVREKLVRSFKAKPLLRTLDKGYPYFTESGNVILDSKFQEEIVDPVRLESDLRMIAGVVEVGIFNCRVDKFYVGTRNGSFESH